MPVVSVPMIVGPGRLETDTGKNVVLSARSRELFIAVVGPARAGASRVIGSMQRVCMAAGYTCEVIKASDVIRNWAQERAATVISSEKTSKR